VLEQKLADYIMPDIVRTGGISEMRKIASMAEAFYIPVSPHDVTGPVGLVASAQTMIATPNFFRLEVSYFELPAYNEALTPPIDIRGGYWYPSDRPGLGHELREDYLARALPL
jgi:galactonate dehydratase